MTDTCVTFTARKPTPAELDSAIKVFYSNEDKSDMQLIEDAIPIVGEACAQLDDGASPDDVIAALGALGVDKNSARTFVGMAARVLLLNEPLAEACL